MRSPCSAKRVRASPNLHSRSRWRVQHVLFLAQSRWERHPHLPTSHFYPAPELAIQHHFIQAERLRAFGYWEDHKRRDLVELFQSADCMKTLALCDILPNTAGGREISELALHCLEVFINQGPPSQPRRNSSAGTSGTEPAHHSAHKTHGVELRRLALTWVKGEVPRSCHG